MKLFLFLLIVFSTIVTAGISKNETRRIFSRLEGLYQEDFKKRGLKLKFKIKKDARINAEATSTSLNPDKRLVIIYSGYLNHSCQTYDSILATLCHEVGHHLARNNKNPVAGFRRYSVEGEADYWAAKYCLPKYYQNYPEDESKVLGGQNTEQEIYELCADDKNQDICRKTLTASYNKIFCHYKLDRRFKYEKPPAYSTPDTSKVNWTARYHPSPQCRLDTHLKGYKKLVRPRCWLGKKKKL